MKILFIETTSNTVFFLDIFLKGEGVRPKGL